MISRRKLGSLGMIALVGIAGLWQWTRFDVAPQTAVVRSAESPAIPQTAQHAQGSLSLSAGTTVSESTPKVSEPTPKVSGSLNWGMYAGTMQDQVQKALTDRSGPMAADLAAKLQECFDISRLQAYNSGRGGNSGGDPAIQAIGNAYLQEEQRQISACQTVGGDQKQVRLQLLNVAVEQKVVGAADTSFQAGVRTPDVLKQVVRDAREGDLFSLFNVATYNPTLFGINADTQSAIRYALKIASADPSVGPRVGELLNTSEHLATAWADEKSATYDYSKMSDAARKEGAVIGARLVQQLTKPKS